MRYLLDTSSWIHYLKRRNTAIVERIRTTSSDQIASCSIVRAELLYGARRYAERERRVNLVLSTLSLYKSLDFGNLEADAYSVVRDRLETVGQVIGSSDLMIAAISLANDLTLVTSDKHFSRIEGLRIEDWTID